MYHFGHAFAADEESTRFGGANRKLHQIDLAGGDFAPGIFFRPQINGIRTRGEKFQFAPDRAERVLFFQNKTADTGAFAVIFSGLGFFVDDTELRVGIVFPEIIQLSDKKFVRHHRDDLVFAAFFDADQTVVFITDDGVIALDGGSDVTVFAVPSDFDIVQCGNFAVDLFDLFDFGAAREAGSVLLLYIRKHIDGVGDKVGKFVPYLLDLFVDLAEFLLVLFNIEPGDTAHRQCQKFVDILIGDIAQQQMTERCQSGMDFAVFLLLTAALFDLLVDTVFKEYLRERFGMMQFILAVEVDFEFLLQISDQFFHIAAEYLTYTQLYRFAVAYHHDARRYGNGTVGVHIQPLQGLFRRVTACRRDPYMHMICREVINAGNADLIPFGGAFNGCHQRFRCAGGRYLPDDKVAPFDIDFGAENDPAVAVVVFADIHQRSLLEVREKFKRSAFKNGDLRVDKLVEVVRQYASRHTDSDTVTSEHEQTRQFGGQHDRFLLPSVIVGNETGDVVVEHRFVSEFGQRTLSITSGGGGAAGKDISEVALFGDEIGDVEKLSLFLPGLPVAETVFDNAALVGKYHQRISDRSIAVRMIVHGVADDVGYFLGPAVINLIQSPQNTTLDRFQSVVDIGDGAGTDDVAGIIEEVPVEHLAEVVIGTLFLFGKVGGIVFLVRDIGGIFDLGIKLITHNRRPPNCS